MKEAVRVAFQQFFIDHILEEVNSLREAGQILEAALNAVKKEADELLS